MTDEGANNLLIAITQRAYKDYVIGLKICRKKIEKQSPTIQRKLNEFESARKFLQGTKIGDYLIQKAEEEVKHEKVNVDQGTD